ncbi:MAG: hypothetical protein ACOVOW_05010 [Spirosomataceae bacterium]
MAEITKNKQQTALGDVAARQLAIATRSVPQMGTITPRWLTHLLHWRLFSRWLIKACKFAS